MTRSFIITAVAVALIAVSPAPGMLTALAEPALVAPPASKAKLLAAEARAWQAAKPTFTKYCSGCHTKAGAKATPKRLGHLSLDTYPLGGHHTATIGLSIRKVLGLTGKKPTMPFGNPGAVKGDELATIKAWTDAWEAAEAGGAHPPAEDHHP